MWGTVKLRKIFKYPKRLKKIFMKDLRYLVLTLYSRFFPLLYILENTLKTGIFSIIEKELGKEWFIVQLNDNSNDPLFKAEITQIINRKPRNYVITPELLKEESGLGLWVEFFNPRIYKLSKGRPIKVFTGLPREIKRVDIYKRLITVKEFRNQLVHSRFPLIKSAGDLIRLDETEEIYAVLLQLIHWLGESPLMTLDQFKQDAGEIRSLLLMTSKTKAI